MRNTLALPAVRRGIRLLCIASLTAAPTITYAATTHPVHLEGVESESVRRVLESAVASSTSPHDESGLNDYCRTLTQALRNGGYLVAQVVATDSDREAFRQKGELTLHVFEGKVGAITLSNTSRVSDRLLRGIADRALCPDGTGAQCPLTHDRLERAQLLLRDVPGVGVEPVTLDPKGVDVGQTAVSITTYSSTPLAQGFVGMDNYGMEETGTGRLVAGLNLVDLLHVGDVLQVSGLATTRREWSGSLQESVPLGVSGVRAQAAFSDTLYALPQSNASGRAETVSAGVSAPVRRSLDSNWTVALDGVATSSHQEVDGMEAFAPRRIRAARLTVSGNSGERAILNGGSNWNASFSWEYGRVAQDIGGAPDTSGQIGDFNKFALASQLRLDLPHDWYVLASARGQLPTSNLDASEKMTIGGPGGVRAYRTDEGAFDMGAILSLEFRRAFDVPGGQLSVGPIFDYANGRVNRYPFTGWQTMSGYTNPALSNHRVLASWGIGADWTSPRGYVATLTWATRFPGSADSANYPGSANSRFYASVSMRF